MLQDDEQLLKDLFTELTDEKTRAPRRKDLILFLKELCAYAQNLQPQTRETFYKVSRHVVVNIISLVYVSPMMTTRCGLREVGTTNYRLQAFLFSYW